MGEAVLPRLVRIVCQQFQCVGGRGWITRRVEPLDPGHGRTVARRCHSDGDHENVDQRCCLNAMESDVLRRRTGVYFQPFSNPLGTTRVLPYRLIGRTASVAIRSVSGHPGQQVQPSSPGLGHQQGPPLALAWR
jgi:hypothetical protein